MEKTSNQCNVQTKMQKMQCIKNTFNRTDEEYGHLKDRNYRGYII